jgi:uncharacterized protein YqeY
MSANEIDVAIKKVIADLGVTNPAEMGKVIGAANKQLAGLAEGKVIAETVKRLLTAI